MFHEPPTEEVVPEIRLGNQEPVGVVLITSPFAYR